MRLCLIVTALLALSLRPAVGQERPSAKLELPRIGGPVVLDGRSDEAAWTAVETLPTTVYEPVFESDPTERTEIRVAYDDEYLYVAGRFFDSEPDGIRGMSRTRDDWETDDAFAIVLDTFNDSESALWFVATPAGNRADIAVSNDADWVGGSPINTSWDSHWEAASVRDETGWYSEMRIPYSTLGFQTSGDMVEMGLITYRFIARKNERHIYPAIPPNWGMGFAKPSQAQPVVLRGVHSRRPVYVTPYLAAGRGETPVLDAGSNSYNLDGTTTRDIGADLKYAVTDNLTLDLTANTDFAQVEADDQQVNLTRFSLFFPEKRPFFQERAGIFDFGTSGSSRLFHSRSIGLRNGQSVPIIAGARLVGRMGDWDLGALEMQSGRQGDLGGENFGVLRLRRQVLNPQSVAGAMLTSRLAEDGAYNVAMGLDTRLNVVGSEYLTIRAAHTLENGVESGAGTSRVFAQWDRRVNRGLSYGLSGAWSGADYNPGTGFIFRNDFTRIGGNIKLDRFSSDESLVRRVQPGVWARAYLRNADRSVESARVQSFVSLELKSGTWLWIGPTYRIEDIRDGFKLSGAVPIEPGRYQFGDLWLALAPGSTRLFRVGADIRTGPFFDGWWYFAWVRPTWQVSSLLTVAGEYEANLLRFDQGDFNAHVGRVRVQTAFNEHLSLQSFLQISTASNRASVNARLRYHFREGTDFWLVFNEGLQTGSIADRYPTEGRVTDRTLLLKYTRTFGL